MAPATICPLSLTSDLTAASVSSSDNESSLSSSAPGGSLLQQSAPLEYNITSPTPGQKVTGNVPVLGTVLFDPDEVSYYKVEISSVFNPEVWTTLGATRAEAVRAGLLEQLNTELLAPGDYTLRLVVVGFDDNFVATPYSVPITIGP
jgi:hypothetical protein